MKTMRWRLATTAMAILALTFVSFAPAQAQGHANSSARTPRLHASYYLSLGDSLAYGYQPNLVAEGDTNPADYRSYAEHYAALHPRLRLVNYGCPGETSTTMVTGGCPWPAQYLHDGYGGAGSQLAAAQAFLARHGAQVKLVTIDIGSNDLLALVKGCQTGSPDAVEACVLAGLPKTLATLSANYATILAAVTSAAPHADVVIFNLYNPLALTLPQSDQLVRAVNKGLATVATGAHVQVADSFDVINLGAGTPLEKLAVCGLTWECSSYANVHPNTLGYWALAIALDRAVR